MVIRIMNGALPLWCVLGCLLAARSLPMVRADERTIVGEVMEPSEYGSISSEALCQSLCGECECRGRLVSENQCQCSCDFGANSAGGQQCTLKVQQLCSKMDVQCDFNEAAIAYVREPRGCHSMSCYEKHHDEGGYDGYSDGGDGYGHDEGYGHGVKQLVCCKDKHKHKEKKHKHKKHKKFHNKHMKFHVVIKGKIPEHSCHGGHEGGEHYEGYEEHGGYRAAKPDRQQMNPAHMPMEMSVWTNRHKQAKKHPFRRPVHAHQQPPHYGPPSHYGAVYPPPYPVDSRAKSAEPPSPEPRPEPMPEPMHHPQDAPPPQAPPPPPPPPPPSTPEPESPPVTPFPKHRLTPPPNLYDGAPIGPKSSSQNSNQDPPKHHSFSPPSPPVRPPMITVDPPPRRIESSRSSYEPSYSSCQFDSYDFNYYHPPPPPPPPPPSSYRSFSSSYDPSYPASHYHPHDQYETPKYYPAYDEPVEYSNYDDNPHGSSSEYGSYQPEHGVHPFSDNEIEDWPEYPPRYPADMFTYNQIVSRQIIEADTALRYMDKPFQPTPRPLRDEFEPATAEVGPVLFDSFGPSDKNYEMYPVPTPPPDAFIPAVPAPPSVPVEFADPESGPVTFPPNSEEALYPQPTPPPHYVLAKETGGMSSFGFEHQQQQWGPSFGDGTPWGYSRSATGPSQFRSGPERSSAPCSRRYH